MAMDKNNFLPYIYINSHYCYSYIDFLETIKAFLNLTLAYDEREFNKQVQNYEMFL